MDEVYGPLVINLDNRKDRLDSITKEFNILGLNFRRIPASNGNGNGSLGCLESHCICLEEFLQSDKNAVMICEDDSVFKCTPAELNHHIEEFLSDNAQVLCLGFLARTYEQYSQSFLRSKQIQTTSCYIVKRSTAIKLLTLWKKVRDLMQINGHATSENWYSKEFNSIPGLHVVWNIYCVDQAWKIIQQDTIFVIPKTHLVVQGKSYSDIEHRVVNYEI